MENSLCSEAKKRIYYILNKLPAINKVMTKSNLQYMLHKNILDDVARGGALGRSIELKAGWSRVRLPMVSLKFFIDTILPAALLPWGCLSL
jgi:hypothetical protein